MLSLPKLDLREGPDCGWCMTPRLAGLPRLVICSIYIRYLKIALGLGALTSPLFAQTALYVDNHGKLELVRRAKQTTALVLEDGKWNSYQDGPFVLKPIPDYAPALITVSNRSFRKGGRAISDNGPSQVHLINAGRFVYNADLEASTSLENVVLVLVLESQKDGRNLYIQEVGDMKAHRVARVSIDQITPFHLTGVRLERIYLFVNGNEVFNSEIRRVERESALDRMVAKRVAAAHDAEIKPLFIYDPIYPAALKPKIKGKAVVLFRVDLHGKVLSPTVTSATDPAFGEAALQAIREWRFLPEIKGGVPVEAEGNVPFVFDPS